MEYLFAVLPIGFVVFLFVFAWASVRVAAKHDKDHGDD